MTEQSEYVTTSKGSLWGNYNELREVIELAKESRLKHGIQKFPLLGVNDAIELLRHGNITGRAVIIQENVLFA